MNVSEAIELLAPFHNAVLFCNNGQLSTGLETIPSIEVNDGMVHADDVYEVIDEYTNSIISFSGNAEWEQTLMHPFELAAA